MDVNLKDWSVLEVFWTTSADLFARPDAEDQLAILAEEERERGARFKREVDGELFLAAHWLLRRVLEAGGGLPASDWTFEIGEHEPRTRAVG